MGPHEVIPESGSEFEQRGTALARALHDPVGTQGAVMHNGRERDALFENANEVNAYEFTISSLKVKAEKDAKKLVELLKALSMESANKYKTLKGWIVTRDEPTAEQRSAVQRLTQNSLHNVYIIGISTLYQRICNSEEYISKRDNAPFGSIDISRKSSSPEIDIAVDLETPGGKSIAIPDVASRLQQGRRILLTGQYGVGKSHTLRSLYIKLRKNHFKQAKLTPFPVYINLRDIVGLRSPSEIFRRHAEEIGFSNPDTLISAWRAGTCILLLDGFDEIAPKRPFGKVSELRSVRWEAFKPIRKILEDTPPESGLIIAGRDHYFSGQDEMLTALGLIESKTVELVQVPDFTYPQLEEYLKKSNVDWSIPDWVPTRPLLLQYLVNIDGVSASGIANSVSRAQGWRLFLTAICAREARILNSVVPSTILSLISRVATLARSQSDVTGPIGMELLSSAHEEVIGIRPDRDGLQLLLRLPGLSVSGTVTARNEAGESYSTEAEQRRFVDRDLADAAFAHDIFDYITYPYSESHPLQHSASWADASSNLSIEVLEDLLNEHNQGPGLVTAAMKARLKNNRFDSILADLVTLAVHMDRNQDRDITSIPLNGIYFENFELLEHPILEKLTLTDCVIETLDFTLIDTNAALPHFYQTSIGLAEGVASLPINMKKYFHDCAFERYAAPADTTAGILALEIDPDRRVALTVLKKIYKQPGSGRKAAALTRGLDQAHRQHVPNVIKSLVSQGWIMQSGTGHEEIYVGVKSRQADALRALESPSSFAL